MTHHTLTFVIIVSLIVLVVQENSFVVEKDSIMGEKPFRSCRTWPVPTKRILLPLTNAAIIQLSTVGTCTKVGALYIERVKVYPLCFIMLVCQG